MAKFITNSYEINDCFNKIEVVVNTTNVKIEPSVDENSKLICYEKPRRKHLFMVENGTLKIVSAKRKWLDFGFRCAEIKLYIPKKTYEAINVKVNTGCVDVSNLNVSGDISIITNTGKIKIDCISCCNFHSKGGTGSVNLNGLVARENIKIKRNTGNVVFNKCDAKDVYIKTNTGSVDANFLTGKAFITKSNTGKINLQDIKTNNTTNGKCEIYTNTGNISLK